jgi:hypothetical protein
VPVIPCNAYLLKMSAKGGYVTFGTFSDRGEGPSRSTETGNTYHRHLVSNTTIRLSVAGYDDTPLPNARINAGLDRAGGRLHAFIAHDT